MVSADPNKQEFRRLDALMRRRAKVVDLQVIKRGETCRVLDADGTELIVGSHNAVCVFVSERYAQRRGAPVPVPAIWQQWIEDFSTSLVAAGHSRETVRLRREQLNQMGLELDCSPELVTGERLLSWLGSHRNWKTETRRSMRTAARQFFTWAAKTRRIPEDVGVDLPVIRQRVPLARPTPEHALQHALMAADPRTRLVLRLAAEIGLRRGEIAQIHGRDLIDGDDGPQLLVHGKGDKPRIVPLSEDLANAVRARGSAADWVFPARNPREHLTARYLGYLAAEVLPDRWTLHTLRHRFASRAYRGSRNLRAVQTLLGHSSIATTERYLALDEDEVRKAMMAAI